MNAKAVIIATGGFANHNSFLAELGYDQEVRSVDGGVVPNLYAVGVDGVENYKGLYTIDIPGSCNANNIWSGRTAAKLACSRL